jgi:hypothetical protein
MSDPKPKIYVFPADFEGRPALIVHSQDEWMQEELWYAFVMRLNDDFQRVGAEQLWEGARRDGLIWADRSYSSDFRLPMQYPSSLTVDEARAKLIAFAPEFDWVVEDTDSSERPELPRMGTITLSWSEVAPRDDDPLTRYSWSMSLTTDMDEEAVRAALEVAAQNADELMTPDE